MSLSIGVRELRQNASRYLRLIEERGEPIQITDRGRPVALLTPLPTGSRLQQLRASGKLTPAVRPWDALPPPISLQPGEKTASELLEELRAGER
jgi:prevent-host-death family protein